jgi:Fe-S cluster assembly iron-binding protein IscA
VHTEEEGYQLTLDDAKDGDQLFEQEGVHYLIIDTEMIEALADATVDVEEAPQGRRLTLTGGKTLTPSEPETAESEPAETEPAGPESEPKTKP